MSKNPPEKQKILVCGDVEGKFESLFKRVEAIDRKSGPFDLLLCVGNFFGVNNKEFGAYKLGDKKVPISTYILGPNKEEHADLYPDDDSEFELAPNVYYLGKRGVYNTTKGIKIAYLSGLFETNKDTKWTCSEKDASDLCDNCLKGNPSFRGVDILLTSQWPTDIIAENDKNKITPTVGCQSPLPSYICCRLKPRYVVAGLEGVHYERPPFRCPSLSDDDGTLGGATRFVGLARVGNPQKEKWLYALSLTPLDKMKFAEIRQKTTDETACPFYFGELESQLFKTIKRKQTDTNQYFYDINAALEENEREEKKKQKRQKVEFDQSKCWFCLASPSVEKHLIITVGNAAYLALAKGGIVEEHFLICPIEHYQSSLGQPEEVLNEINNFKDALTKFYERSDQVPIFFERNYKTSHMQLQVVPIPKRATKELKEIFQEESDAQGFRLERLESESRLDQVIPPKTPYFTVELPDGIILYKKILQSMNFPLNFGREVLASGPILNMTDRVDWRECTLKKEEEEKLVQRIRTDFEPYDFTELS